jgi:MtrB/PioB family decaheme-associated outer membrane protein
VRRIDVGIALAVTLAALPAFADPPRDSIHEGDAEVWQLPDPQGMSLLLDTRKRSPSGFLYPYPPEPYELSDLGDGWFARGAIETGYQLIGGSERETRFTKYVERKDGFLVDGLDFELWKPETGDYADLRAGSIGRHDQFYDFEASRAGWVRFRGSFSGVPHKYASDATSLWNGAGTDSLTLPPGLSPSGNAEDALQAALDAHAIGTVEVQRDRTQLALRVRPLPDLALVAQYGLDERKGAIPSAVGFAYPDFSSSIGGNMEVPAPVDDKTHNARAGLEWGNDLAQLNLTYNASLYRNEENSLTVAQPFESQGLAPITQARLALAPDNDWQNVRADMAVNMPMRSRLTSAISWARSTQNQDLLPPTISNVTIGTFDLANWDTTAALSTKSAHARVDQLLVDVALSVNPWRPLRFRGGYRYTNQETDTNYTAFNPLTGQYGYIVEDGGHAAVLGPDYLGFYQPTVAGSAWRYRTIPFGQSRTTYDVGATYTAPWKTSLDVLLEQEDVDRVISERAQTREQRATVSLNTRALSFATARISYKYTTRDGSDINYNVYNQFTTSALPGFIPLFPDGDGAHNLNQMVRPSVANLESSLWNARLVFALGDRSDLSLAGRLLDNNYGSAYGLTSDHSKGVEADWTVQPSPMLSANAFVSVEQHNRDMQSIRGFAISSNGDAGGPNYPFTDGWGVRAHGNAIGWGGGLTANPLRWLTFETRYTFLVTRETEDVSFATLNALAAPDFGSPVPGSLPELRSRDNFLESSVRVALRKSVALHFFYRYTRSSVDDYHQTDLPTLLARRIYLGHKDSDYEASFYGLGLQISFGSGW